MLAWGPQALWDVLPSVADLPGFWKLHPSVLPLQLGLVVFSWSGVSPSLGGDVAVVNTDHALTNDSFTEVFPTIQLRHQRCQLSLNPMIWRWLIPYKQASFVPLSFTLFSMYTPGSPGHSFYMHWLDQLRLNILENVGKNCICVDHVQTFSCHYSLSNKV
jgi:hypothetical protein